MTHAEAALRIRQLTQEINYHNQRYYQQDSPEISDFAFDQLLEELIRLEKSFPELLDPNSPSQRVGGTVTKEFQTVAHEYKMLSLGNTYTVEEKAGAKMLCSGKDSGAIVPGALIARGDYAKQNPQNVAKFLAIYLRAWSWMNANRSEAIRMMKDFYAKGGVSISDAAMNKEFETRPTYTLANNSKRWIVLVLVLVQKSTSGSLNCQHLSAKRVQCNKCLPYLIL